MIDLVAGAEAVLWAGFAAFLRVGGVLALMPGFGERTIPGRVRLGIALAFTAVILPAVPAPPDPGIGTVSRLVLTESVSGLAIGAMLRLFVLALQTAGSIAAQATSLSQLLGGAAGEPLPTLGHILTIGALALLMITGFHVKAASLVILSYDVLPMGEFPGGEAVGAWGTGRVAQVFALAFTLAAPFVLISALYNLTLGVINRAMPQLMVAFVGAPLITFGAIALLFLVAPYMLSAWLSAFDAAIADPFGLP